MARIANGGGLYMNKFKNFLLNKGIYLIAIGCIAVVCLSGLYIVNVMDKNEKDDPNKTAASSTSEAQNVIALPEIMTGSTGVSNTTPVYPTYTPPATSNTAATNVNANTAEVPAAIKLTLPVEGKIIVDYAMDKLVYNKTLDEWRTHSGVDIAADANTPVKAAGNGKVIDIKKDPRLGYLIIVEHTSSVKTIYANLKEETNVKIGDSVKTGDCLGWIGKSAAFEFADEPHLHFEVLLNDNCDNVWNYCTKE